MVGSETFPPQIAENWEIITHCPAVIGDFTWTGYGYLGETGVYPAIINNAGDLTVAGRRTEASYYRELVFGRTTKPYLAVVAPETLRDPESEEPLGIYQGKAFLDLSLEKRENSQMWRSIPQEMRWSSTSTTS